MSSSRDLIFVYRETLSFERLVTNFGLGVIGLIMSSIYRSSPPEVFLGKHLVSDIIIATLPQKADLWSVTGSTSWIWFLGFIATIRRNWYIYRNVGSWFGAKVIFEYRCLSNNMTVPCRETYCCTLYKANRNLEVFFC